MHLRIGLRLWRWTGGGQAGLTVLIVMHKGTKTEDSGLDVSAPDGLSLGRHLPLCCASVETSSLPVPLSSQIQIGT